MFWWAGLFSLLILFSGFQIALAVGDAYFPQDTTVSLDQGDFTIAGGSDADEVTVASTNVTVKISPDQTFTFKSSGRKILTNNSGYTYSCSSSESSLRITVGVGSSQKTVIITPDSLACDTTSTGGGGSSGVSSGAASAATAAEVSPAVVSGQTLPTVATAKPEQYNLKDGEVISAGGSTDPDVYIVNTYGYKRLFLNPVIFSFYGHLGGFSKVKNIVSATRDVFPTSGLFRNCEANDPKVYGVEVTGEDTGTLHWVNTSGAQAVADDPEFFKKVFCVNNNEFGWYKKGANYTSVSQIPVYSRKSTSLPAGTPAASQGKVKVVSSIGWLNVRDTNSTSGQIVGKVLAGEEFIFVDLKNGWYKIQKNGKDFGWVYGQYVSKL